MTTTTTTTAAAGEPAASKAYPRIPTAAELAPDAARPEHPDHQLALAYDAWRRQERRLSGACRRADAVMVRALEATPAGASPDLRQAFQAASGYDETYGEQERIDTHRPLKRLARLPASTPAGARLKLAALVYDQGGPADLNRAYAPDLILATLLDDLGQMAAGTHGPHRARAA